MVVVVGVNCLYNPDGISKVRAGTCGCTPRSEVGSLRGIWFHLQGDLRQGNKRWVEGGD